MDGYALLLHRRRLGADGRVRINFSPLRFEMAKPSASAISSLPKRCASSTTLVLRSRYVVEGFQAGAHASPLKGASVEFTDHRQYVKGDNLRNLDWKVFGRTDRYYIKQFEEETNLRGQVVIDGSGSMGYGSPGQLTKYDYACHVAAALGYIVSKERDSLGVTIYDNEMRQHVPARSWQAPSAGVSRTPRRAQTPESHGHRQALHTLAEMISRRGMIVLISDLFDDPEAVFNALGAFPQENARRDLAPGPRPGGTRPVD